MFGSAADPYADGSVVGVKLYVLQVPWAAVRTCSLLRSLHLRFHGTGNHCAQDEHDQQEPAAAEGTWKKGRPGALGSHAYGIATASFVPLSQVAAGWCFSRRC